MGEIYADLTLRSLFGPQSVRIRALIDTGSSYMIVTPGVARALGYDPEEMRTLNTTLADGRRFPVPVIGPLEIAFHPASDQPHDRSCKLEAIVLGDQCLMGHVPLQAMDLMLDPPRHRVMGRHPEGPVFRV